MRGGKKKKIVATLTESRPCVPLSTGINRAKEEEKKEEEETKIDGETKFIKLVEHLIGASSDPTAKTK